MGNLTTNENGNKTALRQLCSFILSIWPLLIAILGITVWGVRLEARMTEAEGDMDNSQLCIEYIRRQNEAILKDLGVLSGDVKVVRKLLEIRGYRDSNDNQ